MRKIYALLTAIALMLSAESRAQSVDFGGLTMNNDIVSWGDLYNLSFTSHNYGTARSMAMGNAFTALGADMVSASINPAGIGMYTSSDVSFTPIMQFTKSPTSGEPYYTTTPEDQQYFDDRTARFGMASAGGVFQVYRGTGALTNVNLGFVYNRIADFNQDALMASRGNAATNSMANVFCTLANVDGLTTEKDGRMPFGDDPFYWGTTLAYKTGVINHDDEGWYIDRIGENAYVNQFASQQTRGSIGEYAFTAGFNIMDIFYFGATLGIQNVSYSRDVYYGEDYLYAEGEAPSINNNPLPYNVTYMNYMQRTRIDGSGINFKLGVTARPVNWLRVGVAYHTPTYYTLDFIYDADMSTETFNAGDNPEDYTFNRDGYMYDEVLSPIWEDAGKYAWQFRSPSRLLVGVAATIARCAIVSVDYERSWYQSIRLQDSPIDNLSYTTIMKDAFKGSNTLRVGGEFKVLPFLKLRAGYIWNGSTLRGEYADAIFTHPLPTEQSFVTCGLGLQLGHITYLDFAYQYGTTKYSAFQTFYAIDSQYPDYDIQSEVFTTTTYRHGAVVTLGFRF